MSTKIRMSDSQKTALVVLFERAARYDQRDPRLSWMGAREGISGTTLFALQDRGLAKAQWVEKPYRRIVGRINAAGADYVREHMRDKVAAMQEP